MNKHISYERYQRQVILKEFGEAGQQKLFDAKVLVIGAGGLGCPLLQYLAATGVGTIGIVDDDKVALSNLHRQILFSINDIGKSKSERAANYLRQLNPEINLIAYNKRITNQNALELMSDFDYIADGSDNFTTRYMINDACVLLNKPLIYGAISKFEGQVAVFNCKKNKDDEPVSYRDLFPTPPGENEILNCAEAGVLGVLPGIIGTMMANECIKLITGIGEPLIDTVLTYNSLNNETYQIRLSADKKNNPLIPKDETSFTEMNYEWLCTATPKEFEIDTLTLGSLIQQENIDIIDVRELNEKPDTNDFNYLKIPLDELGKNNSKIKNGIVVTFCQTGKRSAQAVEILSRIFKGQKKIYSLKGGIMQWEKQKQDHE
jgi:molybdopterin/thiamine biosynthesis adenylyltransferase/rhodanese-related sulfurtransferase